MDTVTLTATEYQELLDARDHAIAMRGVVTGAIELLDERELDAFLSAASPLAYWRMRRGLTQSALAAKASITQPYLAQIETGRRGGGVMLYSRLAKALSLRIDDIAPIPTSQPQPTPHEAGSSPVDVG